MQTNINTSIYDVNRYLYLTNHKCAYNVAKMEYGERLKLARKHANLTQDALADETGVKQPSISYLENLKNECTGSEFTARFARACGVSVDWLADEIGDMVPIVYQTSDPKIIAVARIMEPMKEYAKDAAVKDVAEVAELIAKATQGGNGTDG